MRVRRWLLAGLLGLLLALGLMPAGAIPAAAPQELRAIPIREQPFYPQLLTTATRWSHAPLGQVVGESPRDTLLNFYVVMARVQAEVNLATRDPKGDPGWLRWSPAVRSRIEAANELFALAVKALDDSVFPESVRDDMAEEAAIQLKQVLDYVFTHSGVPISIPDAVALKAINSQRSKPSQSWTIPDTAITLSGEGNTLQGGQEFVFSASTVSQVGRMFQEVSRLTAEDQPFATPGFYEDFIHTPGYLAPPKWYLTLPLETRQLLEKAIYGQTILQIGLSAMALAIYSSLMASLILKLLRSYRQLHKESDSLHKWREDRAAWHRVLLCLPTLPATRLTEIVIDDYVNLTGAPLIAFEYLLSTAYFISTGFFIFFLFEALGRSFSQWLTSLRGGMSDLQLRRTSNFVMPICRVLAGLMAVILTYRLMVLLGSSTTVLAFSAVPGLAIGLGASKLLGNMFAGLSIQTDRPVRVGEFCRIGDSLGFVTKIGLRSLELQTLESRITIPNAIAEEATIVNYSRRSAEAATRPMQSLDVRLGIERPLSPEQVRDLLELVRHHVKAIAALQDPLVSVEQAVEEELTLICVALVELDGWHTYLQVRETLLMRLQELLAQVRLSTITLGVSCDTTAEQIRLLPALIRDAVESDPAFQLQSCRLMSLGEFSYDFIVRLNAHHPTLRAFKDSLNLLNQRLLVALASAGIEIPFPTQLSLQREV